MKTPPRPAAVGSCFRRNDEKVGRNDEKVGRNDENGGRNDEVGAGNGDVGWWGKMGGRATDRSPLREMGKRGGDGFPHSREQEGKGQEGAPYRCWEEGRGNCGWVWL